MKVPVAHLHNINISSWSGGRCATFLLLFVIIDDNCHWLIIVWMGLNRFAFSLAAAIMIAPEHLSRSSPKVQGQGNVEAEVDLSLADLEYQEVLECLPDLKGKTVLHLASQDQR